MTGRTVEGTYVANNVIVYITRIIFAILGSGCAIIALLGVFTKNFWVSGQFIIGTSASVLMFILLTKFLKLKPSDCRITFDNIENGIVNITIQENGKDDIRVTSNSGTWNRDTLIITLIDSSNGILSFDGNKNDYKLFRQDNVELAVVGES